MIRRAHTFLTRCRDARHEQGTDFPWQLSPREVFGFAAAHFPAPDPTAALDLGFVGRPELGQITVTALFCCIAVALVRALAVIGRRRRDPGATAPGWGSERA